MIFNRKKLPLIRFNPITPQRGTIILDILGILFSFVLILWFKSGTIISTLPVYYNVLIIISLSWLTMALIVGRYTDRSPGLRKAITCVIKTGLFSTGVISLIVYLFHLANFSRLLVIGTVGLATLINIARIFLSHVSRKMNGTISDVPRQENVIQEKSPSSPKIAFDEINEDIDSNNSILRRLKKLKIIRFSEVLAFINTTISLDKIPADKALILDTHNPFNIQSLSTKHLKLFLNLRRINDIRRINSYFIAASERLVKGGIFIGCVETINTRQQRIFNDSPGVLVSIYYLFDFIWNRVCPKLPVCKQFYFIITKGKNRALTKSEIIGRLYFCGFEIINTTEYNHMFYFIARKIKDQKSDSDPSYGLLIRLRRVGKDGQLFNLFKLRTMHPYAEFAQEYLYNNHNLAASGKFQNDFRVTAWGKVLRKLWIDELPQMLNLLRGDIKLFGVRPLSEHYYSLYPDDIKQLRKNTKPGLVPPYYVDLPKNFDEILESERRYLISAQEKPLKTNFTYFWKAFYNIVFRGARSK